MKLIASVTVGKKIRELFDHANKIVELSTKASELEQITYGDN